MPLKDYEASQNRVKELQAEDEHSLDLYYHALNYRCAGTASADEHWQELLACHSRIVDKALSLKEKQWLPIESAPRNTPILVTDGTVVTAAIRGDCAGHDWPDPVGFGGHEWEFYFEWSDLTHWMPLPPPPESKP